MRIGDVALVGFAGEPFSELGVQVKRRSPFSHTLFSGYTNDYLGYLPTAEAYPDLGYEVDTSVTPLEEHRVDRGPDFRLAPQHPYRPAQHDVGRRGDLPIVEIPVSVALSRRIPPALQAAYVHLPKATRMRGLLSRDYLNLIDFAWLYPVRFDLELMKKAADTLIQGGSPVLNVFIHSNELVPGCSGRVRTKADVEECFERLAGVFEPMLGDKRIGALVADERDRDWAMLGGAAPRKHVSADRARETASERLWVELRVPGNRNSFAVRRWGASKKDAGSLRRPEAFVRKPHRRLRADDDFVRLRRMLHRD